jgi:hypothetical protein
MRVRIAGLADFHDAAVANADVGLHDAPMIDDQRVGDHQIQRAVLGFARGAWSFGPCRRESPCRRRT